MQGLKKYGFSLGHGAEVLPRHQTTLSVSWFNNQVHAVAVHRGQVVGQAEMTGNFEGSENLANLIRELIERTGYEHQTVSLVIANPRLVQQTIEVPPVKGAALDRVIHRQAQKQTMFSGEAAYAHQFLVGKKSQNVLLHLLPHVVLNQFTIACRHNGLQLTSALPASCVLQRQLAALNLQPGDVVAIAAETSATTTLIVADSDGRLFLARTLPDSWKTSPQRLAVDLNRTLLHVSQQFGVTINRGLYLFGDGASERLPVLQPLTQWPIQVSPVPYEPSYWATESLKVRPDTAPNFLSLELQKAPQRRVFAKVVAAAAVFLLVGSLSLTAYSFYQGKQERATINTLSRQLAQVEARQQSLAKIDTELKRKQQAIRLVLGEKPPPKPAWFLAYLGQKVPGDLVVTNLNIKREEDYYRVSLSGTVQQGIKTPDSRPVLESISTLKEQLAGSPFYMRIVDTNAPAEPKPTGLKAAISGVVSRIPVSDWVGKVASTAKPKVEPLAKVDDVKSFYIEGTMR